MTTHDALLDGEVLRELRTLLGAGLDPVLAAFGTQSDELLAGLAAATAAGDAASVRRLAHLLKGSAGSVGARQLGTRAAELEQCALSGDIDAVRERLVPLPALVAATVAALQGDQRGA
jgi:HPt (histidine-containing phosphotransfer) domain-containing protein